MKKICDITLTLLIIILIITTILIFIKYIKRQKNEEKVQEYVKKVENIIIDTKKENQKIDGYEIKESIRIPKLEGYEIEGIIEIPKINIKYPIINETNDITMKKSITKFWGKNLNGIGNYTMAGHNNKDGTMFGKVKYLEIGDIIKITDLNCNTVEYEIFKIYTVMPDEVSCVESVENNSKEITLITCTNGHKNRLVTKAKEIK